MNPIRIEVIPPDPGETTWGCRVWSGAEVSVTSDGFSTEDGASLFGSRYLLGLVSIAVTPGRLAQERERCALAVDDLRKVLTDQVITQTVKLAVAVIRRLD